MRASLVVNALEMAWVDTIKSELIKGRIVASFEAAEHAILGWISGTAGASTRISATAFDGV